MPITLTAGVRANLLSLQSTADLLATTQNHLATGLKVNSALENPINFFTASGLNARAGDIGALLDSSGNGVQVLQAANAGITAQQKLVDTAKSIALQAQQATVGYTTKSSTSTTVVGATAGNILGPDTPATASSGAIGTLTNASPLSGAGLGFAATDTFVVNGKTITIGANASANTVTANGGSIAQDATISDLVSAINTVVGANVASFDDTTHKFTITTTPSGPGAQVHFAAGAGFDKLKLAAAAAPLDLQSVSQFEGKTLTIAPTAGGTATTITLGNNAGRVHTLDQLNAALTDNNLQASLDATGKLTISTTNNAASSTIGALAGSAFNATPGAGILFSTQASAPVADPVAQSARATLVKQFNTVIDQIRTTALDSSFNGTNLLQNDTLDLTLDETGRAKLQITGVDFSDAGLGLVHLTPGTDFIDNKATDGVLGALNAASTQLRSQASAFGANLSIVNFRQQFSKDLINVLQTGAGNLTLADSNEEAANSQALTTRQAIGVQALSLANQSQQAVLQLLR